MVAFGRGSACWIRTAPNASAIRPVTRASEAGDARKPGNTSTTSGTVTITSKFEPSPSSVRTKWRYGFRWNTAMLMSAMSCARSTSMPVSSRVLNTGSDNTMDSGTTGTARRR